MTAAHLQKGLIAGSILAILLVLTGWIIAPKESVAGILAAFIILALYGITFWFVPHKLETTAPFVLSTAILFGLLAGLVFAIEILLEYILLPKDNTIMGTIEFGSVFFLYFLASLITSYRTNRIRNGIVSAVVAALFATLIWTIVTLSVFYLFRGSPRQELIFQAEGNYADFSRSGMKDFNLFIVEDFMGAVFFHSLLGPIVAFILGFPGGIVGRLIAFSKKRQTANAGRS
jgi:hypothetical protein